MDHKRHDDWELVQHLIDFECLKEKDHQDVHAASMFVKSAASHRALVLWQLWLGAELS